MVVDPRGWALPNIMGNWPYLDGGITKKAPSTDCMGVPDALGLGKGMCRELSVMDPNDLILTG